MHKQAEIFWPPSVAVCLRLCIASIKAVLGKKHGSQLERRTNGISTRSKLIVQLFMLSPPPGAIIRVLFLSISARFSKWRFSAKHTGRKSD